MWRLISVYTVCICPFLCPPPPPLLDINRLARKAKKVWAYMLFKIFKTYKKKKNHMVTQRQPTRQRTTNASEINKRPYGVNTLPVCERLATDQFDPWQVVPRQVFTPYSRLLVSTAFVVVSRIGCLALTGVKHT